MADTIYSSVQEYYGKTLKSSESLATNACTIGKMNMPKHIKLALSQVHEEVSNRYILRIAYTILINYLIMAFVKLGLECNMASG